MQPLFGRASRLLRAVARRLFFDLEERVRDVDELDLPRVASLRLDTAMWKQEADRASGSLRRRSSAVETCRREVEECEQEVVQLQEEERILGVQCDELRELETRRAAAVALRGRLGPKPTPDVKSYVAHETREVERGGLFGWLVDWWSGPRVERVPVTRQRRDYSRVEQWEAAFNACSNKITRLDERMQPMAESYRHLAFKRDELAESRRRAQAARGRLRRAEARLADEEKAYRKASLVARRARLKRSIAEELETVYDLLPDAIERNAAQMLETISQRFVARFGEVAERQLELLRDDMERCKKSARAQDDRRSLRSASRKRLQTLARDLEADITRQGSQRRR